MENSNFRIKRIKIHNFKNFKDLDIELNKFNVLIGHNASGKSNFKRIFSFLKDIVTVGLEEAISFQGGSEYIRNFASKDPSLEMEIHFTSDDPNEVLRVHPRRDYSNVVTTNHIIYKFSLEFNKNLSYNITSDELTICCSFYDTETEENINGKIIFSKKGKTIKPTYDFPSAAGSILQRQYEIFEFSPLSKKQLLLEAKLFGFIVKNWNEFLSNMATYDFEPKLLKSPSSVRSQSKLHYDGSNLSFILYQIRKDRKKMRMLENFLRELLPFFETIAIERTSEGSLRFILKETYNLKKLPSMFVSDGTVNILAIMICLFLQNNRISVIEEPERNIHPGLLSDMMQLMDESSDANQIIITTHNSDILDYVSLENILIMSRDKNGNSTIIKPNNHKDVQKFKDTMRISYLMNQNMLK